jgi:hypothetical protein
VLAGQSVVDRFTYTVTDSKGAAVTTTVSATINGAGSTGVISTGEWAPVDVEFDEEGDWGIIRNADGTLTEVEYDQDDGWTVGAGVDYGFGAGDLALDGRVVWAEVEADDSEDDGTLAVVDLESGDIDRVRDVNTGLTYHFGDVTDVAVDRRVQGQADVLYAVDRDGAVYEIDSARREVVSRTDTRVVFFRADASAAADVNTSPKLAVAPGSRTVYVANGNRISVVKRQTVRAARSAEGVEAAAATDQLVHRADLDITLGDTDEITALEVGADGTLYATVVSADATAGARLVRISVDATGMLGDRTSVELGRGATSLAINDELDRAYVGSAEDQNLSVVGLRRLDVLDVVSTGVSSGVAVAPGTGTVLVANPGAHTITLVKESAVTADAPITITLDWGAQPQDLDAHLVGSTDDGSFHVSYENRTWTVEDEDGIETAAVLDVDDQNGDGPETIALNRMSPGTYLFYVDNFSNDGGLIASVTTVMIKDQVTGETLYQFELPASGVGDAGTERYWSVFTMTIDDEGTATITPVTGDPFVSAEPTLPPAAPQPPDSPVEL